MLGNKLCKVATIIRIHVIDWLIQIFWYCDICSIVLLAHLAYCIPQQHLFLFEASFLPSTSCTKANKFMYLLWSASLSLIMPLCSFWSFDLRSIFGQWVCFFLYYHPLTYQSHCHLQHVGLDIIIIFTSLGWSIAQRCTKCSNLEMKPKYQTKSDFNWIQVSWRQMIKRYCKKQYNNECLAIVMMYHISNKFLKKKIDPWILGIFIFQWF